MIKRRFGGLFGRFRDGRLFGGDRQRRQLGLELRGGIVSRDLQRRQLGPALGSRFSFLRRRRDFRLKLQHRLGFFHNRHRSNLVVKVTHLRFADADGVAGRKLMLMRADAVDECAGAQTQVADEPLAVRFRK